MVLCIYRAPTENLKQFYNLLEKTLNHLLQLNTTYLICGDLNINFSIRSKDTLKLKTLMNTLNLTQVVEFPTRITNNNGTLIDTIFVNTSLYLTKTAGTRNILHIQKIPKTHGHYCF